MDAERPPGMPISQWLIERYLSLEARVAELERRDMPSQPARLRPLPSEWEPTVPDLVWAKEKYPDVDETTERQNFKDYYGSRGDTRRDWDAAYRNWISKAQQFAKAQSPRRANGPASRTASIDQANDQRIDGVLDKLAKVRRQQP